MLLDNLFSILGETGTALMLLGIVAFVGYTPAALLLCPRGAYARRLSRGR